MSPLAIKVLCFCVGALTGYVVGAWVRDRQSRVSRMHMTARLAEESRQVSEQLQMQVRRLEDQHMPSHAYPPVPVR